MISIATAAVSSHEIIHAASSFVELLRTLSAQNPNGQAYHVRHVAKHIEQLDIEFTMRAVACLCNSIEDKYITSNASVAYCINHIDVCIREATSLLTDIKIHLQNHENKYFYWMRQVDCSSELLRLKEKGSILKSRSEMLISSLQCTEYMKESHSDESSVVVFNDTIHI